jgi:hypothetical protein
MEALYPPWPHGADTDAAGRGLQFTVAPADVLTDFHGSIDRPGPVLYVSGNYFFAMTGRSRLSAMPIRNIAARLYRRRAPDRAHGLRSPTR